MYVEHKTLDDSLQYRPVKLKEADTCALLG